MPKNLDIPTEFVQCRGFGRHDWKAYTVVENTRTKVLLVTEICLRCRSQCSMKLDSLTGEQLTPRRISYTTGYRRPGKGRLPYSLRNLARLEAYHIGIKVQMLSGSEAVEDGGHNATEEEPMAFQEIFREEFNTPADYGKVREVLPRATFYEGFQDTSKQGTYDVDRVWNIKGGWLTARMHVRDGVPLVGCYMPMGWEGLTYGRFIWRLRTNAVKGFKMAPMLWPTSDIWDEGEIDFPECDPLGNAVYIHSYRVGVGMSRDMSWLKSTNVRATDWHTYQIDWTPTRLAAFIDGKLIGETREKHHIPRTPFRSTLQFETSIGAPPPLPGTVGLVNISKVVISKYV